MPSSLADSGATRTLNDNPRFLNGPLNGTHRGIEDKSSMDEGRPKNEDVFLNIARTDSARRDSIGRSDFRRVSENNTGLEPVAFQIALACIDRGIRITLSCDFPNS